MERSCANSVAISTQDLEVFRTEAEKLKKKDFINKHKNKARKIQAKPLHQEGSYNY